MFYIKLDDLKYNWPDFTQDSQMGKLCTCNPLLCEGNSLNPTFVKVYQYRSANYRHNQSV